MKKFLIALTITSLISSSFIHNTFAKTKSCIITQNGIEHVSTDDNIDLKIELNDVVVNTPYNINDVNVNYYQTDNGVEAVVTDKSTGEQLQTYGELYSEKNDSSDYFDRTVYSDKVVGPFTARLYADLKLYSSGSFRQICEVKSTYWEAISEGAWYLEDTTSNTDFNGYAATSISIYGGANMVAATAESSSQGFSIDLLDTLGFSASTSTSKTYYMRYTIDKFQFGFSVY